MGIRKCSSEILEFNIKLSSDKAVGPQFNVTRYLLRLSRATLRNLVSVITGHGKFRKHLYIIGVSENPICLACGLEEETALVNLYFRKFKGLPPLELKQLFDHLNLSPSLFIFPSIILYPIILHSRVHIRLALRPACRSMAGIHPPKSIHPSKVAIQSCWRTF
jgi:hypothetical protein